MTVNGFKYSVATTYNNIAHKTTNNNNMKKLYIYGTAVLMALSAPVFTSCGGGNDDDLGDNPDVGPDKPSGVLSPDESKDYLEEVGKAFLQQFKPEEQKQLIELISYYDEHYGDLDMPEDWEEDDIYLKPADVFGALKNGTRGNINAMTRAISVYDFNTYAGIYQPKGDCWEKTGDSDKIIFRFFKAGETCELVATNLGGANDSWRPSEFDDTDDAEYIIPYKVGVSLTESGKELMNGTVNFIPNVRNHTVSADYDVTAANLRMIAKLEGTDTRLSMNAQGAVNGMTLVKASTVAEGNYLCDYEVLKKTDDFSSLLTTANAEMDVIGKVQVKSKATNFSKVNKLLDKTYDKYEIENYEAGRKDCDKDCKELNRYVVNGVYYSTGDEQAKIIYQPALYGDPAQYWEWSAEPVISFSDGTTYDFDEFFDSTQFLSVKNLYEDLVNSYMKLWNKDR